MLSLLCLSGGPGGCTNNDSGNEDEGIMRSEGIKAGCLEEDSLQREWDFLHYLRHRRFLDVGALSSEGVGMSSTFS